MKITKDTVATLSYTVTETNGKVVGRTEPGEPVTALIGHRFLIKGLEEALEGHEKGDPRSVQQQGCLLLRIGQQRAAHPGSDPAQIDRDEGLDGFAETGRNSGYSVRNSDRNKTEWYDSHQCR